MAVDLKALEARLNSDESFRAKFLKDPVKTFEAEGIVMPDAAKKNLAHVVEQLIEKLHPKPGSSLEVGEFDVRIMIHHPGKSVTLR